MMRTVEYRRVTGLAEGWRLGHLLRSLIEVAQPDTMLVVVGMEGRDERIEVDS